MKEDIETVGERNFEKWLGGEAHVFVKDRKDTRWSRFRVINSVARNAALVGLCAGIILGAAAATAFFRGTTVKSGRDKEEKSPSSCAGKERNGP